jgi:hypothetical protein
VLSYGLGGIGVALMAIALSRWVFAPHGARSPDYGLLVAAATVATRSAAERAQSVLLDRGIRATLGFQPPIVHVDAQGHATRDPGGHDVLVFPADLTRARDALTS